MYFVYTMTSDTKLDGQSVNIHYDIIVSLCENVDKWNAVKIVV